MTRILGIDTATAQAGIAIGDGDTIRASFHLVNEGRHSESLTPAIEMVSKISATPLQSLTAVAVDIGPGLFTGLRVGLATAKSIAYALGVPTIPVSSLEILAHAARLTSKRIVSVIDALSDEVYYASYTSDGHMVREASAPSLGSPDAVAAFAQSLGDDVLMIGDGARRYADVLASVRVTIGDAAFQHPSAAALIELAARKLAAGDRPTEADVQIFYLRKPYVHT